MLQHFWSHGAFLHHGAVPGDVPFQHGDAAGLPDGVFHRMDHFRTENLGSFDVLAHGLAGDGQAVLFN